MTCFYFYPFMGGRQCRVYFKHGKQQLELNFTFGWAIGEYWGFCKKVEKCLVIGSVGVDRLVGGV